MIQDQFVIPAANTVKSLTITATATPLEIEIPEGAVIHAKSQSDGTFIRVRKGDVSSADNGWDIQLLGNDSESFSTRKSKTISVIGAGLVWISIFK